MGFRVLGSLCYLILPEALEGQVLAAALSDGAVRLWDLRAKARGLRVEGLGFRV